MKTFLEYKIIEATTLESLAIFVRTEILDGWAPQGGVCVASIFEKDYDTWFVSYYQAMVKVTK